LKRVHLFEFEDLQWFPDSLRNYATDFLQFGANAFDMYRPILPMLKTAIETAGNNTIIDIASGGGGGLIKIAEHLKKENPALKIILTDYFPNLPAFERTKSKNPDVFDYVSESVDARAVPTNLKGLRTQFLSLHHFKPDQAKAILQNAIDCNQPIGIFEGQQRSLLSLIPMIFSPITLWLTTPFIRPFRIGRILFTYLIPILPLVVFWDGIVSVLRTYTSTELVEMIHELKNHDRFTWQVDIAKGKPNIGYLIGTPIKP
jgi:hypothetical protein